MKVSVLIPCFNEENYIKKILEKTIHADYLGFEKEIIVINDGSSDRTKERIQSQLERIIFISYNQNRGKGFAIRKGLDIATGDIILIQDADLEYNPCDYKKLLSPFEKEECQVVYGYRTHDFMKSIHKINLYYLGGRFLNLLSNLLFKYELKDIHTGYKVFRKSLIKNCELNAERFEICHELTGIFCGKRIQIVQVPISYNPRTRKEGKKISAWDGLRGLLVLLKIRFKSMINSQI